MVSKIIPHTMAAIVSVLIMVVVIVPFYSNLSDLEGRFWPAVSKLEVFKIEGSDGVSRFHANFHELRACEFVGINWYLGGERIAIEYSGEPANKGPASSTVPQSGGAWLLHVGELAGTRASALHRCHSFWPTVTEIYP